MKIVKEQMLRTDPNAFKGRESFKGHLKISIKEIEKLDDEEFQHISGELRKINGHIVSQMLPFYSQYSSVLLKLSSKRELYVGYYTGKVLFAVLDHKLKSISQKITKNEAKLLLQKEPRLLFDLQDEANKTKELETTGILFQESEIPESIMINETTYTVDDDFEI